MARSSSTGLPYLIRRPGTKKFAYWRDVPAHIAPFIEGEVEIPWSKVVHRLSGRSPVKISLKTGDDDTARLRWTHIHAQVEAQVQIAQVSAKGAAQKRRSTNGSAKLPPEAVSTIAAQARHDVLAEHDRTWIDPTFTSPLTEVVARLMHKAGAGRAGRMMETAQRASHELLKRESK